jgi:hypothetical protein
VIVAAFVIGKPLFASLFVLLDLCPHESMLQVNMKRPFLHAEKHWLNKMPQHWKAKLEDEEQPGQ